MVRKFLQMDLGACGELITEQAFVMCIDYVVIGVEVGVASRCRSCERVDCRDCIPIVLESVLVV